MGIAYITLCHSKSNRICDSNYDANRPWKGISPFGYEVIREMNRVGLVVDMSHSADRSTIEAVYAPTADDTPFAEGITRLRQHLQDSAARIDALIWSSLCSRLRICRSRLISDVR